MVRAGQVGQREQRLHHPLHLLLAGPARSAHRALDLLGRVGEAGDAALAGGEHDHPAGLPDGERGARVRAEVEVLDGERGRRVLVEQRRHAGVDGGQARARVQRPPRSLSPRRRAPEAPAAARHHAVARVRRAGIDAEGDHADGILRGGADAFRAAVARCRGTAASAAPLDAGPAEGAWSVGYRERRDARSPQRPGPVPDLRGLHGRAGAAGTMALARLADRLGYHRYWVAEHHGGGMIAARARGPDRPDRIRHAAPPGRQRRRDAAPLQPAQGRGELQHPRRAVPGADRPRPRARVGHGPDDHLRAPARPPPGGAGRLPGAARRAPRLLRRRLPGRPPFRRLSAPPRAARGAGAVAARRPRPRAPCGRPSSASPTRSPTSSTGRVRRSPRTTARRSSRAAGWPRPPPPSPSWALCAEDAEEARRLTAPHRMAMAMLRLGRPIPVPPVERALRFLEATTTAPRGGGSSWATLRRCARGSRRWPASTAPTR